MKSQFHEAVDSLLEWIRRATQLSSGRTIITPVFVAIRNLDTVLKKLIFKAAALGLGRRTGWGAR